LKSGGKRKPNDINALRIHEWRRRRRDKENIIINKNWMEFVSGGEERRSNKFCPL